MALMTAVAVLSVLVPLAQASKINIGQSDSDDDIALYRASIAGVERDAGLGLIDPAEASTMQAEIARRLLASRKISIPAQAEAINLSSRWARIAASLVGLFAVPLFSLGVYSMIGNPDLPDQPIAARLQATPDATDIAMAVAKIEAHLAKEPDDVRGYEVIVPVYLRLKRYEDAANAMGQLLRLQGETADGHANIGEVLVAAANGMVSGPAESHFAKAFVLDQKNPKARYYLAMLAQQKGDSARAKAIWSEMLAEGPQDAPWLGSVKSRIAALEGTSSLFNDSGRNPMPGNDAAGQIAALPQADQQVVIRSMVEGLSARLGEQSVDAEGWLRLIRAWSVLNEPVKARSAFEKARKIFADKPDILARMDGLATELKLGE